MVLARAGPGSRNETRQPALTPALLIAALGLVPALPHGLDVSMLVGNNHVVVNITLNAAGPFRFIVNSGAGNLIDPAVAAAPARAPADMSGSSAYLSAGPSSAPA